MVYFKNQRQKSYRSEQTQFRLPKPNHRQYSFQKDFYEENINVTNRTISEINDFLKQNDIITSKNAPRPITTFYESSFPNYIIQTIENETQFIKPTPIQCQSWPIAMKGHDLIGIAQTGSGKTLSFILPAIIHINGQPLLEKGDGPIVLILAPTRELVLQIENEITKFAYSSKISFLSVFGGVSKSYQRNELFYGVEIVVATPGRLLDFIESKVTHLRRVTYLVLDEADRMLDMGFENQIRLIISQIRPDRQTLLFSATWPKEIRSLASEFLRNPIQVQIGSLNICANKNVTQNVFVVENHDKLRRLMFLLMEIGSDKRCLIFTATKMEADYLSTSLKRDGFNVAAIHGDKKQFERERVLRRFKSGKVPIMVATDVASRGIDVKDVMFVINYDYPMCIEDYVHRIGRTGRGEKRGTSYTFFTREDARKAADLIKVLRESGQKVPKDLSNLQFISGGAVTIKNRDSEYLNPFLGS